MSVRTCVCIVRTLSTSRYGEQGILTPRMKMLARPDKSWDGRRSTNVPAPMRMMDSILRVE